ncbi:hypothetical protein [Variovorax sp. 22077]|uniref:hypothetical protein n=1 Tax=Variovorax sp. 22077 TaxID=3453867 RepID=UPI0025ECDA69|nr:hypothetical protein [uncultured Variovorax sp.]
MKKRTLCLLLSTLLTACANQREVVPSADTENLASKLVGIWQMAPLRNGIANVVEFTQGGESKLYSFNCITSSSEVPEVSRYTVDGAKKQINLSTDGTEQSLKIVNITPTSMMLSQKVGEENLRFLYRRSDRVAPLCGSENKWATEKSRRTPFSPSDFDTNPYIPANPNIERYAGKWANERGVIQIEVLQDAAGGKYKLNHDPSENWRYLYGSVTWRGDELHFRSFAYSEKKELFDHPYHKSESPAFLTPLADPNRIKWTFFTNGKPSEYTLTKK